jgi:hypothetical protein
MREGEGSSGDRDDISFSTPSRFGAERVGYGRRDVEVMQGTNSGERGHAGVAQ